MRPATHADAETLADLRARALHSDLVRLDLYDPPRNRARFMRGYQPEHTGVLEDSQGRVIGCIALRPATECWWLEHFYLDPDVQGRGLGTSLLRFTLFDYAPDALVARWRASPAGGAAVRPVCLNVLAGSAARRLYERFGFTVYATEAPDGVDEWMLLER
ncbi:GNAT family N-acetyltransferase [Micrococcales bacterium 31B]|nr:GNAT family N-acetyltransferase [Micrococcales bacterium 31B]